MANLNKVQLIGRLARDVELRVTPKGTSIGQFSLAINRKWKDGNGGEQREEVTFIECEAWGKTAELCAKYLSKGSGAYLGGRLQVDTWEDKETHKKRSKMKVVVDEVQFLGSKSDGAGGGDAPADTERQSAPPKRNAPPPQEDDTSEDVPF